MRHISLIRKIPNAEFSLWFIRPAFVADASFSIPVCPPYLFLVVIFVCAKRDEEKQKKREKILREELGMGGGGGAKELNVICSYLVKTSCTHPSFLCTVIAFDILILLSIALCPIYFCVYVCACGCRGLRWKMHNKRFYSTTTWY